jgi:hypothetical protein
MTVKRSAGLGRWRSRTVAGLGVERGTELLKRIAHSTDPHSVRKRTRSDWIRRELAATAFQLCTVGGLILGLLDGMARPPGPAAACAAGGKCVADGVLAGMTPILAPCLGGVILGMLVGVLVGRLIRTVGATTPQATSGGGRWIRARYAGRCESCAGKVLPGDRVFHSPQRRKVTCPACAYR